MKKTTVYASKTGVEFTPVSVEKGRNGKKIEMGRVKVRAFKMEEDAQPVYVFLTPQEAHKLSRYLSNLTKLSEAKKLKPIIHKTEKEGKESISTVEVEKWISKDGKKSGYAIIVSRDKESVNIPIDRDTLLYLADFLKALAIEQSWETVKKVEETEKEEIVEEDTEDIDIEEDVEEDVDF